MSEGKNRKIEVTLAGDAVQDGRVSVSLFAKTLQSIQEVVFQIAGSRLKREMKGPVPVVIRKACELFLVRTEPEASAPFSNCRKKKPLCFRTSLIFPSM